MKYKTPNGQIVEESVLRNRYGDKFDSLVSNGTFTIADETPAKSQSSSGGKYMVPNGELIDESVLKSKYGNRFEELVSNGTLKKKDGGAASDTITSSEVQLPSNGQLKEDQGSDISTLLKATNGLSGSGLAEGVLTGTSTAPKKVLTPEEAKLNKYAQFLNDPTATGIDEIVNSIVKDKAAARATSYKVEPKTETDALIHTKVLEAMGKNDVAVVGNIKDKFYSGSLAAEDVALITSYSNLVQDKSTISNQKIAEQVNAKTKALRDNAMQVHANDFQYSSDQKKLVTTIGQYDINIETAKNNEYNGNALVDASTTGLPDKSNIHSPGKKLVSFNEYIAEQQRKKQETEVSKNFLEYKWNDKYRGQVDKTSQDVIAKIENYRKSFNLGSSWHPDAKLIQEFSNEIARSNPTLIAGQSGIDAVASVPIANLVEGTAPDLATALKNEQRYFTWTDPKTNIPHQFKTDDFTDVQKSVWNYYDKAKPTKEYAIGQLFTNEKDPESIAVTGRMVQDGNLRPTGEFAKFFPLVKYNQQIGDYFNSETVKNVSAVTDIEAQAVAQSIDEKYKNVLQLNPRFKQIQAIYDNKMASISSDADAATWDKAKADFYLSLQNDPELKKIFDKADKEKMAAIGLVNKKKMDFIINGVKQIDPSLNIDENGLTVYGASPQELQKFTERYKGALGSGANFVKKVHQGRADYVAGELKSEIGGFLTSLYAGVKSGTSNLIESFARYYDIPSIRDDAMAAKTEDVLSQSEFIKQNSQYHGWSSLLNPNYYAYNIGQSAGYMAPGIIAGVLTGGGAGGAVYGTLIGAGSETFENSWDTFNDMYLNGVKPNGEKIGIEEASQAAAQDFATELLPNLILGYAEFGALFRGAPKTLKRTIGSEILGATGNLAQTGAVESFQEGLQGYFQQSARDIAQGKPEMDFFDYIKTDDFRQNFFGGLTGGIGFGAGGFGKRVALSPVTYNTWKGILNEARTNTELQFNENSARGYALNEELNGRGAQFRDGLLLRISQKDYKDNDELKQLLTSFQYSQKLKTYAGQIKVNSQNVNGLAAVHNMIMADEYAESAKTLGENTAAGKLAKEKAVEHYNEAKNIYSGNAEGVSFITNAATNSPIFLSQRDATALSESGDVQRMWNKGLISDVSPNLKVDKGVTQGEGQKIYPEEVIRREAQKGNLPGYNDIINNNPGLARQALIDLAGQKYGVASDGSLKKFKAEISNKAVDNAITELFPDRKSLVTLIHQKKAAGLPTEVETAQYIGDAKNDDKELFTDLFKTAQKEYTFGNLNSEEVVAAAYHKMQNLSPDARTPQQSKFINDVHTLLKTYQDAETIRENQRQAGEEGNAVRQGSKTGSNDLQRAAEEKAVNAETQQQTGEVKLPDHGVTVGEMIDRAGSYLGRKGKFIQRGDEVVFKDDGFGGLTHVLGKFDDVVNRPIDDFGIQAEQSVIAHNDGVFTIRGEKFVNNFKNPLDAINKSKKGYAVTLENEKGQKRTFRGSIAEDIATQIFYQEIKKEENGKELFEGFINNNPEVIQDIQNGGYTETPQTGAVDNTGEVLLEAKDEEIRSAESDLSDKTEEDKVAAAQTVEEQKSEAIKNALRPDVKLEFAPDNKLVGAAADRFGMIDDQNKIRDDFEKLNELIECCYG